ncbi:MAG: 6-carboxytetrahydropterin synthase [Phycisphaerales bacterium]
MVSLRRTVRFSLPPPGAESGWTAEKRNAFAGWPSSTGIAVFGAIEVVVEGEPDSRTGYLVNITEIDRVVRDLALPFIAEAHARQFAEQSPIEPSRLLVELATLVASGLAAPLRSIAWILTPSHSVAFDLVMPHHVELRQSFEFSASHRLHCPEYDDDTNRRIFGKCNNPNGHGHNYRLEVAVAVPLATIPALPLGRLEEIVDEAVIRRFDHKHLNSDCPEFASLNPSVEHIAKVCHDLLVEPFRRAGGTLQRVTVWETEKTACSYPCDLTPR